jgi:nitrous oxidase accessory protein NosD
VIVACLGLFACGDGAASTSTTKGDAGPATLHVPEDYPTIQKAVDDANPGDLILIAAGTYTESVTVETEDIALRGLDRNKVIIQGDGEMENGIFVLSDGVAVENLTVERFKSNGVMFAGSYDSDDPLTGFRVSHVTVYDNGLYGVYAFAAQGGLIENVYASAHPDGGVYVGQCNPCNTVVTDVLAENNAVGYLGTNSGGDLFVVNSVFRNNRVGVQPNSSHKEQLAPGVQTTIAGNLITDNDNPNTPKATIGFGVGVGIGGSQDTQILRNRISGNPTAGIAVADNEDFHPSGQRVEGNVLEDNGVDLLVASPSASGVCFTGNTFTSSGPPQIETAWPCSESGSGGSGSGGSGSGGFEPIKSVPAPDGVDGSEVPAPPPQPSMADAAAAPVAPVDDSPALPDLATIEVPAATSQQP